MAMAAEMGVFYSSIYVIPCFSWSIAVHTTQRLIWILAEHNDCFFYPFIYVLVTRSDGRSKRVIYCRLSARDNYIRL